MGVGRMGRFLKLAPKPDGTWTESTLYNLGIGPGGGTPDGGVIFDQAGNLYGTTQFGGDKTKCLGIWAAVSFSN